MKMTKIESGRYQIAVDADVFTLIKRSGNMTRGEWILKKNGTKLRLYPTMKQAKRAVALMMT